MDKEQLRLWLPIGISLLSFCLASFALGWNIYRDVVLKARVRVQLAVVSLVEPGVPRKEHDQYVKLGITNHGPGKVRITGIVGKVAPLWRRLTRRVGHFVVMPPYDNPLSTS